jgi:hypothetical protein
MTPELVSLFPECAEFVGFGTYFNDKSTLTIELYCGIDPSLPGGLGMYENLRQEERRIVVDGNPFFLKVEGKTFARFDGLNVWILGDKYHGLRKDMLVFIVMKPKQTGHGSKMNLLGLVTYFNRVYALMQPA